MLLRIKRELFRLGEFEEHTVTDVTKSDICREYNLDPATTKFYSQGMQVDIPDDVLLDDYPALCAVQFPGEAITAGTAISIALSAVAFAGALVVSWATGAFSKWDTPFEYSYELRGATNPRRFSQRVGVLLGKMSYCPDEAALPYTSYSDAGSQESPAFSYYKKQNIHQLFCCGYSNVNLTKAQEYAQPSTNPNGYVVRVGTTPIDVYNDTLSVEVGTQVASSGASAISSTYTKRCVESTLSLKTVGGATEDEQMNNALTRTLPSNTVAAHVGLSMPFGYYKQALGGPKLGKRAQLNFKCAVQYKKKTDATWTPVHTYDVDLEVEPCYLRVDINNLDPTARYDVRVVRLQPTEDITHPFDLEFVTSKFSTTNTVVWDVLQADTVKVEGENVYNSKPVIGSDFTLLGFTAVATDKLNGYINQLHINAYAKCRSFLDSQANRAAAATSASMWGYPVYTPTTDTTPVSDKQYYSVNATTSAYIPMAVPATFVAGNTYYEMHASDAQHPITDVGTMNNPASVLLHILTDSDVNPSPAADSLIDWQSFRDWWVFCNDKGYTCNAWISSDINVGQLCTQVAATGRASLRMVDGRYTIVIGRKNPTVTQMFTPRNAWDMQETYSFDEPVYIGKATYLDETTEESTDRYVAVEKNDDAWTIVYDYDLEASGTSDKTQSYDMWGVTRARQAGELCAYQLLSTILQKRVYKWSTTIESALCSVGDVVYLANDVFMYSYGYGRISSVRRNGSNQITDVFVDDALNLSVSTNYGINVRCNDGSFAIYNCRATDGNRLTFATPLASTVNIEEGNLFMYGAENDAGRKVIITEMAPDANGGANITAVDYMPELYDLLDGESAVVIPTFKNPLSIPGEVVAENAGVQVYQKQADDTDGATATDIAVNTSQYYGVLKDSSLVTDPVPGDTAVFYNQVVGSTDPRPYKYDYNADGTLAWVAADDLLSAYAQDIVDWIVTSTPSGTDRASFTISSTYIQNLVAMRGAFTNLYADDATFNNATVQGNIEASGVVGTGAQAEHKVVLKSFVATSEPLPAFSLSNASCPECTSGYELLQALADTMTSADKHTVGFGPLGVAYWTKTINGYYEGTAFSSVRIGITSYAGDNSVAKAPAHVTDGVLLLGCENMSNNSGDITEDTPGSVEYTFNKTTITYNHSDIYYGTGVRSVYFYTGYTYPRYFTTDLFSSMPLGTYSISSGAYYDPAYHPLVGGTYVLTNDTFSLRLYDGSTVVAMHDYDIVDATNGFAIVDMVLASDFTGIKTGDMRPLWVPDTDVAGATVGTTLFPYGTGYFVDLYIKKNGSWHQITDEGGGGGAATWGSITGTLSNQSDLQSALNAKYTFPANGIPKTDLAAAVQTSLGLADTSEQKSRMQTAVMTVNLHPNNKYPSCSSVWETFFPRSIPEGGTEGQVLAKTSDTDFAVDWVDPQSGGGVTSVNGHTGAVTLYVDELECSGGESQYGGELAEFDPDGGGCLRGSGYTVDSFAPASHTHGYYTKPSGGIPKTDLASAVRTSLGKADTALQEHQSLAAYRTSADQDTIDANKVDKVSGKGLSTNDYTTAEKSKLAGIADGAEVNVNADWNAESGDAQILNKPTIPTVNNPTVTITQGGVTKGSFTLNQSGDTTIPLDAGGGGGGAVSSVNGQTGAVVTTFVATYGTTTLAEIQAQAAAGQYVCLPYISQRHPLVYLSNVDAWFSGYKGGMIFWERVTSEGWTADHITPYTKPWGGIPASDIASGVVNDPTITVTQGGVAKGSFTLNQSGDATIALDAGGGSAEVFRYATSVAVNQSGDTTITFPTAFPSGCYSVVVTPDSSSTASYTQRYHIHSITSTGFKFYQRARCIDSISYIAIGY